MKTTGKSHIVIIASFLMLIMPNISYAIGDPMVVYAFFGFGLLHVVMGCTLIFSYRYKQKRLQFISLYLVTLVVTWFWAINYRGPNFTFMYIGLIGAPLLTFILLHLSMTKKTQRKN